MDLENIRCENPKYIKKCKYCGKELHPIGLDFLYENINPDSFTYEKCDCKESILEDQSKAFEQKQANIKVLNKKIIDKIYIESYMKRRYADFNFENYIESSLNKGIIDKLMKYVKSNVEGNKVDGLIISGDIGQGKTHLACAIANKLIEDGQVVLIGRVSFLMNFIKDTFTDKGIKDKEIIDLYSTIDMLIIDDLGTEKVTKWELEQLYKIVQNRYENKLPIVVTTRFNKNDLKERLGENNDIKLVESLISKMYFMCYGISIKL